MLVIRPIRESDYQSLWQVAENSGVGFTSLPTNENLLRSRIKHSEESFATVSDEPGNEGYLLVMEDTETGEVVGTSGLESSVGLDNAFYHYHLGKVVHSSHELGIHNTIETLALCNDYTGAAELCTLFLNESHRFGSNGRVLSRFRFLFLAEFQQRFGSTVIAEMRGVSDESGQSPFWHWLQEHFFSMDFPTADYLSGIGNKIFIAELMPRYPIYVNLLSEEAQAVIGHVHDKTMPALKLLQKEGFVHRGYVDIFDGGPTVECELKQIRSVRESRRLQVTIGTPGERQDYIICNTELQNFRATQAELSIDETANTVILEAKYAQALNVNDGDWVRILAL